jgi:hypothetical protein
MNTKKKFRGFLGGYREWMREGKGNERQRWKD